MASSAEVVALARRYDFLYAAVGVHPHDAKAFSEADVPQLTRWLTEEKKVRALGEIGLDYYYDLSPRDVQKRSSRASSTWRTSWACPPACTCATRTATRWTFCARTGGGCRDGAALLLRELGERKGLIWIWAATSRLRAP